MHVLIQVIEEKTIHNLITNSVYRNFEKNRQNQTRQIARNGHILINAAYASTLNEPW